TDRFGGHIVQGHLEATGTIQEIEPTEQWTRMRISLPAHLAPFLIDEGSITANRISPTVADLSPTQTTGHRSAILLIPETLEASSMGDASVGDTINLETDLLARHIARMIQFDAKEGK